MHKNSNLENYTVVHRSLRLLIVQMQRKAK